MCIGLFAKKDELRSGLDITHDHSGLVYVSTLWFNSTIDVGID